MKRRIITTLLGAAFVITLAVTSVNAQTAGNVAVTVPFDFIVAGKTHPAGDYILDANTNGAPVMRIQSRESSASAYFQIQSIQGKDIQADSKLIFNKYGNQAFLSQVWVAGRSTGRQLRKSSRERLLQRELAGGFLKRETVAITARSN